MTPLWKGDGNKACILNSFSGDYAWKDSAADANAGFATVVHENR